VGADDDLGGRDAFIGDLGLRRGRQMGQRKGAHRKAQRPLTISTLQSPLRLAPWLSEGVGGLLGSLAVFKTCRGLRHRAFAIHGFDLARVALVHETALQLHGRRQFLILGRQLALDQEELLDGFRPWRKLTFTASISCRISCWIFRGGGTGWHNW